jgi:hypothetical protein
LPPSLVTRGRERVGASNDMMEGYVWLPRGAASTTQRARAPLTP